MYFKYLGNVYFNVLIFIFIFIKILLIFIFSYLVMPGLLVA